MNLQENIQRIKGMMGITEESYVNTEDGTYVTTEDGVRELEYILNKRMPKIFPWWKKIDLEYIGHHVRYPNMRLKGTLFVDRDWAINRFESHNTYSKFDDSKNLYLGHFLVTDEVNEIEEYVKENYSIITGQNPMRVKMFRKDIKVVAV